MKEMYYHGRHLLKELHLFAFPRTGSHFLFYALNGLFDLVAEEHPHMRNQEAIDRQKELDPVMLYGLDLREDGVPFCPIRVNARATGMHGLPEKGTAPAIVLIRDPRPTAYSLYRTGVDRWGFQIGNPAEWVADTLRQYAHFYDAGLSLLAEHPADSLLVRWEDLIAGPSALQRIVDFIGVRPKLSCDFVHRITRFDILTVPGRRTFYRVGTNEAWKSDPAWTSLLGSTPDIDFTRFGY